MGGAREGRSEGVEEGADLLGELLVNQVDLASRPTGFSSLSASGGTEQFPKLFPGQAMSGLIG
jgi:hypothetical protein